MTWDHGLIQVETVRRRLELYIYIPVLLTKTFPNSC
jgi:hypothetical protein